MPLAGLRSPTTPTSAFARCDGEFDDQLAHPLHEFTALRSARPRDVEALTPNTTTVPSLQRDFVVESRLKPLLQEVPAD